MAGEPLGPGWCRRGLNRRRSRGRRGRWPRSRSGLRLPSPHEDHDGEDEQDDEDRKFAREGEGGREIAGGDNRALALDRERVQNRSPYRLKRDERIRPG